MSQRNEESIMLLQFSVSNFESFKDEKILSTKAIISDIEHKENLLDFKGDKYLPTISIYGANASGKSNLIKALTCAILLVRNSHLQQLNNVTGTIPFLFDDESRNRKTKMDFIFTQNDIKYSYGFTCDQYNIYDEYLYEYKTAKATLIFERSNINVYRYNSPSIKKELKPCEDKNSPNKLFLSTATQWNCNSTKEAYKWFAEGIDTYTSFEITNDVINFMDTNNDDDGLKPFLLNVFKHADINISDYNFESKEIPPEKVAIPSMLLLDEKILKQIKENTKEFRFNTIHNVEENGKEKSYPLDFEFESKGTKTLLSYGINILKSLQAGKTMVVDELETSLHTLLVKYIVNLFNDHEINRNNAQLIFTTHDANTLDLDIFRRDQIFFIEKDLRGVSDLYPLTDFSPRKDENIRKGYLQGRYGAIPFVRNGVEW